MSSVNYEKDNNESHKRIRLWNNTHQSRETRIFRFRYFRETKWNIYFEHSVVSLASFIFQTTRCSLFYLTQICSTILVICFKLLRECKRNFHEMYKVNLLKVKLAEDFENDILFDVYWIANILPTTVHTKLNNVLKGCKT